MANWKEVDYRHDWVSLTLNALKTGFSSIKEMGEEMPWFDGLWQLEHAESIFGIAFITAQTYILGTVEDINSIRKSSGKSEISKINYYDDDKFPLPGGISRILLINAIANYYKHHDEWGKTWKKNLTTLTLYDVGIDESTEFPCYEVAAMLPNGKATEDLENLLTIISEWREYILTKYK
jgi:hypothetical protein